MRERLKIISNNKKEFSLCCLEVLNNIELLSFLDKNKIKEMKDVLVEIMKRNYDCNKIFNYIDKNWFSQYLDEINFSEFNLTDYKSQNNSDLLELYKSYHISELYHRKLDSFLPKYAISINTIVAQFKKLLKEENNKIHFDLNNINQKFEYHLQCLIHIINKNEIKEKPKWIGIKTYLNCLKQIIKENNEDKKYTEPEILHIIKDINYWNIINTSNKSIEEILEDQSDDILGTRPKSVEEKKFNEYGIECITNIEKYEQKESNELNKPKVENEKEEINNQQMDELVGEIEKLLDMSEYNQEINSNKKNNLISKEEINNKENKNYDNFDNNQNSEDILTSKDIFNK